MKLYEVKALAHETQSRIRQDLNAWNDFLEHASRVYRYRFMDQILIYAQRPDAVACATMNIWNSKMGCWIKKGNRGIALIDESNSRKLKYVWDVASVVPKMGGHLPRLWIVEYENYCKHTRVEEIMDFAKKINAKKIGIATCVGLLKESRILADILRRHGFEVYGVGCKAGTQKKTSVGIPECCEGVGVNMCNPILQAKLLNKAKTDL
ncbi:DUF1847 domain-containing protein, partial [Agathobacter rectalis]|uniref:DUF1847 domain-containing protein n=1 Tax=Agathobacter rectalis TaxID=39491 RepID=UPI0027D2D8DD